MSRKPLAPARMAWNTYSSRSKVLRISTLVWARRSSAVIRRVASSPSVPGMRMSMRTTSGRSWMTTSTASAPSPAWPTTSMSSAVPSSTEAGPDQGLVVDDDNADHAGGYSSKGIVASTRKPPPAPGPTSSVPP